MKRVLLIDRCPESAVKRVQALSKHFEVHCWDGMGTLDDAFMFVPDVVVCDMMLPNWDVAGILRAIRLKNNNAKIIVIACDVDRMMTDTLEEAAVSYLMVEPVEETKLVKRIKNLYGECVDPMLRQWFVNALQDLGVERNHAGFFCLMEALEYLQNHPNCLFTDELYPYVAKMCCATACSVEKAMKRCIEKAWHRRRGERWRAFGFESTRCPANHEFLQNILKAGVN